MSFYPGNRPTLIERLTDTSWNWYTDHKLASAPGTALAEHLLNTTQLLSAAGSSKGKSFEDQAKSLYSLADAEKDARSDDIRDLIKEAREQLKIADHEVWKASHPSTSHWNST
jgi:hypothetical protein